MKREDGFYWVNFKGDWIVAEWLESDIQNPCWLITRDVYDYFDDEFDDIGEQIKKPEI